MLRQTLSQNPDILFLLGLVLTVAGIIIFAILITRKEHPINGLRTLKDALINGILLITGLYSTVFGCLILMTVCQIFLFTG